MQRDEMEYDVVIVGAGPAGLAAAIRLKQRSPDVSVCVLEKGPEVGAHLLSGAVIDPRALDELLPDWRRAPLKLRVPVQHEEMLWLKQSEAETLPHALLPKVLKNDGCEILSLGELARWLATQAEALGVEIYPGFAGAELSLAENGALNGVITGDFGIRRNGQAGPDYAPGMLIKARYTLLGEGARGSLTRKAEVQFKLRADSDVQKFGIGLKELWRAAPARHQPGLVVHSLGWPLDNSTGGGGFLYHQADGLIAVGFVVHLDYANPYLNPYEEFQRFKIHPAIRAHLDGGERLEYGARAIAEGGLQSLPKLTFPGGALIGDSAGFINLPRIKGIHNALNSGMIAADAVAEAIAAGRGHDELAAYPAALKQSWTWKELDVVRNAKPMLSRFGTLLGVACTGAELTLRQFGIRLPWTLKHAGSDHAKLRPANEFSPIIYPKPDGVLSFDKLTSLTFSGVQHTEDQPAHLRLTDPAKAIDINLARYASPESRYCPAGVYEIVEDHNGPRMQINASNCVHCKTCDIKDPTQNIVWVTPEGGGGPQYSRM
ncbi:electron transfer flavoprotein-ubiquinone oxidoreductase [Jeongeupia sp. USM3]|uniref:electron transfer flavoprotein-ubiquinone oxidoreductase n=1 Tax=Jeongeupia sp. USM3 TaxID=1906741 RepID=UPI00089DF0AA|nr:electron transfer flavoprotein-ubiquinone oxidoreductase [Jeongeupia sp. USM3]AOY00631.1 electron transfer flavoprotein-ubiquinone oxidoreductase [Jeongeupia sp. USM3]